MKISLYIAKRYLFTKSSNNAINIMTLIAAVGVIIATAALFIVLSVFTGLKEYSLQFSNFVDPDLKLLPSHGKSFYLSQNDILKIKSIAGIDAYSTNIEERIIIKSENKNLLASLKGVDSKFAEVTQIDSVITDGYWLSKNSNDVVAGWGIAHRLSFGILDFKKALSLYVPKPGKGQISSIKSAYNAVYVNNVGLFDINPQFNDEYLFSDISLAQKLLNYKANQYSAIELKLKKNSDEETVRQAIIKQFNNRFIIKNRAQLNDALFKMLNTEHLAIYLIFTLVIIIALFNVIGAIIMMILDKKTAINTLYSLGTTPKMIKLIFFYQGSLMALFSGIIGLILGFIIVFLQQQFELILLTPELPYPVKLNTFNGLLVISTIFGLGIIASQIASQRITKSLIKG